MPLVNAGQRITAGLLSEDYATGDTTNIVITQAALTNITNAFTIPANDAAVGTLYRLTAFGNGTWGGTAQQLNFQLALAGTAVGAVQSIAAAALPTSIGFRWNVICLISPAGPIGATCVWHGTCLFTVTQTLNVINPGTPANNTIAAAQGDSSGITQDSTIANTLSFQVGWGSTTGAPTIQSKASVFEKLGG